MAVARQSSLGLGITMAHRSANRDPWSRWLMGSGYFSFACDAKHQPCEGVEGGFGTDYRRPGKAVYCFSEKAMSGGHGVLPINAGLPMVALRTFVA